MDGILNLRSWLINNGGYINTKLSVELLPNIGFGLKANAPISPYETLCVVPLRTCLRSVSSINEHSMQHLCSELLAEKERDASSFYSPFISVLPRDNSFLPSLWPTERMAQIQGTSLAEDALYMKERWQMHPEHYPAMDEVGKENLIWARSTLQCRAFSFKIPKNWDRNSLSSYYEPAIQSSIPPPEEGLESAAASEKLVVFFPFISLANHDDKKFCTVSLGDASKYGSGSVVLHTDYQRYKPGEMICISYGELSFQQKLLSFGWVDRSVDSATSFSIVPLTIPNSGGRQMEIKCRIVSNKGKVQLRPAVIRSEITKAKRLIQELSPSELPLSSNAVGVHDAVHVEEAAEALLRHLLSERKAALEIVSSREGVDWRRDDSHYVGHLSDEQYIIYVEARTVDLLLEHTAPPRAE